MSYDCNGNLTFDGTYTYGYDAESRLLTASKAGLAATYQYDPLGRRTHKSGTGVTERYFLSDGSDEIAEYDASKSIIAYYVPGPAIDEPVAVVTGSGPSYSHEFFRTNHQGSVIAMTADDGSRVEGPFTYDPYGNCFDGGNPCSAGEPYRFTGRRLDPETGLLYYRARYYDPAKGRFLQTDPVGYDADLNLYTYVGNDPTNKTDPTGMANNCGSGNTGSRIQGAGTGHCEGEAEFVGSRGGNKRTRNNSQQPGTENIAPTYGTPQNTTHKPGDAHEFASEVLGTHLARMKGVRAVYYHKRLSTTTGGAIENNSLPDVTVIMNNGVVRVFEILSPGQTASQMQAKYWGTPETGQSFRLGPIT